MDHVTQLPTTLSCDDRDARKWIVFSVSVTSPQV
jgi:hypothetical protein